MFHLPNWSTRASMWMLCMLKQPKIRNLKQIFLNTGNLLSIWNSFELIWSPHGLFVSFLQFLIIFIACKVFIHLLYSYYNHHQAQSMKFCPLCFKMLMIQDSDQGNRLFCHQCRYYFPIVAHHKTVVKFAEDTKL